MSLDGVQTALPDEVRVSGVGYVRLDFRHSKNTLKNAVAQWIELNWVKQPNAISKMGRPKAERLKDDLNALGAWRLLEFHKLTANEAAEETQKLPRKGRSAKALFENPAEWSKARKRANENILKVRRWFGGITT